MSYSPKNGGDIANLKNQRLKNNHVWEKGGLLSYTIFTVRICIPVFKFYSFYIMMIKEMR